MAAEGVVMNVLRFLLVSSAMGLVAACSEASPSLPDPSPPEEVSGPASSATVTATWKAAEGRRFGSLAATSAGDKGAIVYTESEPANGDGVVQSRVLLQRLDGTGAERGSPVELDDVKKTAYSGLKIAVATDGNRYLACWEREIMIACARVPVGEGPASPALSVNGVGPALAYGSGTFALAYGLPDHVGVMRVASDGSAVGAPAVFAASEGAYPRTSLAATKSGFALLEAEEEWEGNVRLHRLDIDFAAIDPPIDLGQRFWGRATLDAHGTNVAIGLAEPYGGQVFMLEGSTVTQIHAFSAGGKLGMNTALLANDASFDMLSTHNGEFGYGDLGLRHRTLEGDKVIASPVALLTDRDFEESALALLRLDGELVLAATDRPGEEIMVARVHRP